MFQQMSCTAFFVGLLLALTLGQLKATGSPSAHSSRKIAERSYQIQSSSSTAAWDQNNVTADAASKLGPLLPKSVKNLLYEYDSRSWFQVADLLSAVQDNPRCDTAQYLLVDDITTISGMGWATLSIIPLALQALIQQRVLVHATSVIQGVTWAWCAEPPFSVDCYFRPWTPCLQYLRNLSLTIHDLQAAPSWDDEGSGSSRARFTAFRNIHLQGEKADRIQHTHVRSAPFYWAEKWFKSKHLRASRFYWYGLVMNQYFSPAPDYDRFAVEFLLANGLRFGERFVVAHVRHGSKGVEQRLIEPSAYIDPLKRMLLRLKTSHVFLVTETSSAAEQMSELARQHGFHMFTLDYKYPNADTWNSKLSPSAQPDMKEIGRASAQVLAITRRGSGLIGTLHSAWAKISVAHMYGFHGRPVPVISLAPGFGCENGYTGEDHQYWTFNVDSTQQNWPCPEHQQCSHRIQRRQFD